MDKKKSIIISIMVVILITVLVFGVTYAYISAVTNSGSVDSGSGMLDIKYTPPSDDALKGILNASSDRSGGLIANASASLEDDSVDALFNMYITPTTLSDNLKIDAFKWEVLVDNKVINSGNFKSASEKTPIKVVDGYELDTTPTTFNIYIWLDASMLTTGISGASFTATIGADSVKITGDL